MTSTAALLKTETQSPASGTPTGSGEERRAAAPAADGSGSPAGSPEAPSPTRARNAQGDPQPATGQQAGEGGSTPKKKGKAGKVMRVILLLAAAAGAYEGYGWWTHGRFMASTDDAYVSADITTVLSKVSGYVASIEVADNQHVDAGQVIARIDDGDYRLAVQSAKDNVASAEATVERIARQIIASQASVEQASASVEAAEARDIEAKASYERQVKLTAGKVSSQASLDTALANMRDASATVASSKAAVSVAEANVAVLESQKKEAERAIATARTALEKAERDLDFTVVRAPVSGVVGNRAAQVGSLLQTGSRVASIVPLADARIDANFKETQLDAIQPGASVKVTVDAYPELELHGTVKSLSPATGSVFSLLPSENATGNFTKVVQRVPVRISVPVSEEGASVLRPGMSVVVEVDTRTGTRITGLPGSKTASAR